MFLHKTENSHCLPLSSVSGSEKNWFWCVSGSEKSRLYGYITVGVRSDVPLPLHAHTAMFDTGQWLCR